MKNKLSTVLTVLLLLSICLCAGIAFKQSRTIEANRLLVDTLKRDNDEKNLRIEELEKNMSEIEGSMERLVEIAGDYDAVITAAEENGIGFMPADFDFESCIIVLEEGQTRSFNIESAVEMNHTIGWELVSGDIRVVCGDPRGTMCPVQFTANSRGVSVVRLFKGSAGEEMNVLVIVK